MDIRRLTPEDIDAWAGLLAVSFRREQSDMLRLWSWFHDAQKSIAWGAWEGARLIAHYSCLKRQLHLPGRGEPISIGLSTNMAVHPDFRGRGLVKQVSAPVYDELERSEVAAGVGFSDVEGVTVDRRSRSYGYHVVGKMRPSLVWPLRRSTTETVDLIDSWPDLPWGCACLQGDLIRFDEPPAAIRQRYTTHPFRHYRFGVWVEQGHICGMVIDQPLRIGNVAGSALLAVYADNLPELLRRWVNTINLAGARFIRLLSTPASPVLSILSSLGICWPIPYSRQPYYLTVKPLRQEMASALLDYNLWDCISGDIL